MAPTNALTALLALGVLCKGIDQLQQLTLVGRPQLLDSAQAAHDTAVAKSLGLAVTDRQMAGVHVLEILPKEVRAETV